MLRNPWTLEVKQRLSQKLAGILENQALERALTLNDLLERTEVYFVVWAEIISRRCLKWIDMLFHLLGIRA